jgi:hypothetical protein
VDLGESSRELGDLVVGEGKVRVRRARQKANNDGGVGVHAFHERNGARRWHRGRFEQLQRLKFDPGDVRIEGEVAFAVPTHDDSGHIEVCELEAHGLGGDSTV